MAGGLLVASSVGRAAPEADPPEAEVEHEATPSASVAPPAGPRPDPSSAMPLLTGGPALDPTAAAAARARRPVPVFRSGPGDRPYQLDIGPTITLVHRRLKASAVTETNPRGDSTQVDASLAPGFVARAHVLPWLAVTFRYMRSLHTLDFGPRALGTDSDDPMATDKLRVLSLQGALQPTWVVTPTLRLYASIGVGWASVQVPSVQLLPPGTARNGAATTATATDQPAKTTIRSRRGTMRELPLGIGISWWVWPRWLVVSYEASYAKAFSFGGDAYSPDTYVKNGDNATIQSMPTFLDSFSHQIAFTLSL